MLRPNRRATLLAVISCFVFLFASGALGNELPEPVPARHALVIANSAYEHLRPIASSAEDSRRLVPVLKQLEFTVTEATFTSRQQLEDEYLVPFRQGVRTGDLVLVYYSGHGFAYGPFNYFASTEIVNPIAEERLLDHAIALEELADFFSCAPRKLGCRSAGVVVFIHDACRSFTAIEVVKKDGKTLMAKGETVPPDIFRRSDNFLIAFSSELGTVSLGNTTDGQPSLFTMHLVPALPAEGIDLEEVLELAAIQVQEETADQQKPGLSDWNRALIYLRPTADNIRAEREAWEVAHASGLGARVRYFLRRHTLSRYAAAARKWLNDHPEDVVARGYTHVSPEAVERAWSATDERLAVRRTQLPIAFRRSLDAAAAAEMARLSNHEVGLVPSGTSAAQLRRAWSEPGELPFDVATARAAGDTVLLHRARGFSTPALTEGIRGAGPEQPVILEAGTPLRILSVEPIAPERFVIEAELPDREQPVFLSLPRTAPPQPLELGRSLQEVLVNASVTLPDLADIGGLEQTLAELRAAGRTITWVSIAAGDAAPGEEPEDLKARVEHVRYALQRGGVSGKRLTAVAGRTDLPSGLIRVRFFGI